MINKQNLSNNEFYSMKREEVVSFFNSDIKNGISEKSIKERTEKYGNNDLKVEKDLSFFQLYFMQVKSFLNLLLLFLVIFAFVVWRRSQNQEYIIDSIIIGLIFMINTIIGAYQNFNSRKIAKTLSAMLLSKVIVLRDGKELEVDSTNLVCGDVILLKGGDKVPADCYLLESSNLKVDESVLTGESINVEKKSGILKSGIPLTQMTNMIFMNTYVVSGETKAIVVKTGMTTEMGKIAQNLNTTKKKISFLDEIDVASKTISKFAIILIAFVSLILYLKGFDIIEIFLIASALIIGAVPEGLPVIVISLLSKAVHKLSKKKVLVKDIGLLETLGSINILCTDKTGTLTTNQMSVKMFFVGEKSFSHFSEIEFYSKKDFEVISKITSLANEAEIVDGELEGESEDLALVNFINEINSNNFFETRKKFKIEMLEPFSSETKFIAAKSNGILYKKGAFEVILQSCDYILKGGKVSKITESDLKMINSEALNYTNEALRLIGFSYVDNGKNIFVGFCGLYDKPKDNIDKVINHLYGAGIEIKMITGDNKNTAIAIAKECGFRNVKGVEWEEIKDLSEKEIRDKILECNVFARVLPEFKEKIVEILQNAGNRVAISGDGVNDTIALRDADIGVVMGSGASIAKESGDLILINNNIEGLPLAMREGRGIFLNIRKVVNYLLTANLAEVLVIFIASFLGIIPFTAIQILWVNFVTDIFPAMAIGVDEYPNDIMQRKPTGKNEKIINNKIKFLTLFISLKKVVLILAIYYIGLNYSGGSEAFAQTVTFTWLVLTHFIRIAALRFEEKASMLKNKYVVGSILGVTVLQLILIYTPIREFFGIVSIPLFFWIYLIGGVLLGIFLAKFITKFVDFLVKNYFNDEN